jgi:uncharacterized protein (TIGR02444 family)
MDQLLELDNPFWHFSLAVYAMPCVQEECLSLQDGSGVNVNILLYCAWRGTEGDLLSAPTLQSLNEAVHAWRSCVVLPLRRIRNDLRGMSSRNFSDGNIEALRSNVLDVELRSEQIEQAILYRETALDFRPSGDRFAAIDANLALYLSAHGMTSEAVPALKSNAWRLTQK